MMKQIDIFLGISVPIARILILVFAVIILFLVVIGKIPGIMGLAGAIILGANLLLIELFWLYFQNIKDKEKET